MFAAMNLFSFRRLALVSSILGALALVACSSDSTNTTTGPECTGAGEGGTCATASDCKPAACKCVDGSGSDTATSRVCINKVCNAKSFCESQCKDKGGIANSATCS
ncbi:MAG: hypothetical protein JWM74_5523 [Myxococcaceae bacterium]|nr:hypothetical protein [Myxococcaceae bacterium]